jgi:hypothetical protein
MADEAARKSLMVNRDVVQIEFVIDDLIKQLVKDRSAIAACNGCNGCKSALDLPGAGGV